MWWVDWPIMVSFSCLFLLHSGLNQSRKSDKRPLKLSRKRGSANIRTTLVRIISCFVVKIPLFSHLKAFNRCKMLVITCWALMKDLTQAWKTIVPLISMLLMTKRIKWCNHRIMFCIKSQRKALIMVLEGNLVVNIWMREIGMQSLTSWCPRT